MKLSGLALFVCWMGAVRANPIFGWGETTTPAPPPPPPPAQGGVLSGLADKVGGFFKPSGGGSDAPATPAPATPAPGSGLFGSLTNAVTGAVGGAVSGAIGNALGPMKPIVGAANLVNNALGVVNTGASMVSGAVSESMALATNISKEALSHGTQIAHNSLTGGQKIADHTFGMVDSVGQILVPAGPLLHGVGTAGTTIVSGAFDTSHKIVSSVNDVGQNAIAAANKTVQGFTDSITSITGTLDKATKGVGAVTGILGKFM
uniref:Venom hemolysin-like protein 2 n=1 Tax=Lethocerus distinctifemur TaxID=280095 RepID=A0A2K8JLU4_9HEMI|nr:venom hemolysin-like protein 2 [Lethocerus distinctifemur]